jgi:apolipoprotein N-acyltransferase
MAIEDIVGKVLYAAAELLGIVISKDKKPAKKLGVVGWSIIFVFVAFLFWLTISYS